MIFLYIILFVASILLGVAVYQLIKQFKDDRAMQVIVPSTIVLVLCTMLFLITY